jgi:amidase
MSDDPLAQLDAWEQANQVRRGELTAAELVEAAIRRIEALDPRMNSVIARMYDEARAAAADPELPEGRFRGVPFLMKDLGATQAGQPYYLGNRALRDIGHRAAHDTYLGARFRRAGLIALGKTNTPEFGLQSTTQPLAFGPTRNPWNLEHSPGGSSGGSAAAVAAGLVPFAHANDGAGSIRIPAAWCGVVGLKPSRGRVAVDPTSIGRGFAGFALTRSVRDAAELLDAVHGQEPGDLFRVPPPQRPYVEEIGSESAGWPVTLKGSVKAMCGPRRSSSSQGRSASASDSSVGGGSHTVGVISRSKPPAHQDATRVAQPCCHSAATM